MLIETGFIGLCFLAWKKGKKRGGKLTVEEETMFREAFENIRGKNASSMFRKLADGFDKYGHPVHAKLLRTRADYLDRSPEKKAEHEAIVNRAMQSVNAEAVEQVATGFEKMTATGIARDLRKHAKEVREGKFKVENKISAETSN